MKRETDIKRKVKNLLSFRRPRLALSILGVLLISGIVILVYFVISDAVRLQNKCSTTNPASLSYKNENPYMRAKTIMDEKQSIEDTSVELADVQKVIDRVVSSSFDSDSIYRFGDTYPETDDDYLVLLAQSEDGLFIAYGCASSEYGNRGILINYKLGGDDNYNIFDYSWDSYLGQPQMAVEDYDKDGRDEVAFSFLWGEGTGFYVEKLLLFETFDTSHMDAYEFTEEQQAEEINNLVETQVNITKHTVDIVKKGAQESIISDVPYGAEDNKSVNYEGINYSNQVRFTLGREILMDTDIGIMTDASVMPEYRGQVLSCTVKYDYSDNLNKGYFSLVNPSANVY